MPDPANIRQRKEIVKSSFLQAARNIEAADYFSNEFIILE